MGIVIISWSRRDGSLCVIVPPETPEAPAAKATYDMTNKEVREHVENHSATLSMFLPSSILSSMACSPPPRCTLCTRCFSPFDQMFTSFVSSTLSCSIAAYRCLWHALPSSTLFGGHYLNLIFLSIPLSPSHGKHLHPTHVDKHTHSACKYSHPSQSLHHHLLLSPNPNPPTVILITPPPPSSALISLHQICCDSKQFPLICNFTAHPRLLHLHQPTYPLQ